MYKCRGTDVAVCVICFYFCFGCWFYTTFYVFCESFAILFCAISYGLSGIHTPVLQKAQKIVHVCSRVGGPGLVHVVDL